MAFTGSLGGKPTSKLPGDAPAVEGHARLNLHLIRSGQILPIGGRGEYIVGRVSEGQSILPDIDLEPFSGYESGVSRLHARIRIDESDIWITDLGSANGTHLNNEKLDPHHAYKIGNKDVVRLGRMSIQALVAEV
jgi:pSer/pThr/pTyr-binding forkhead associated (FHA) protein